MWFARVALLVAVLVVAGAAYARWPATVAAVDFTDALTGPASPQLVIPFDKYALTPDGLMRISAARRRLSSPDRPMVRTVSDRFLDRDFVVEIDVAFPADNEDLAFVGYGDGVPGEPYNEPGGGFVFRIHHFATDRSVRFAVIPQPENGALGPYVSDEVIGELPANRRVTVRIERVGDKLTCSMPGQETSRRTFQLSAHPNVLRGAATLFFGNSAEGTTFSNLRVSRPD